jgi:hypothetical protein
MPGNQLANTKSMVERAAQPADGLNVRLVVHRPPSPLFYESTQTLVLSAHGALMAFVDMLVPKQRLLVQNVDSGEQQECRVVYVERVLMGAPRVAVEFSLQLPSFWRIAFPPPIGMPA